MVRLVASGSRLPMTSVTRWPDRMISSIRIALLSIKLVMRTKAALFFTFLFPLIFLFVYAGIFARGNPRRWFTCSGRS